VLAIARNVSVPFGAPYEDFGIYNTEYRTVIDLTNKRYFFELTTSPNVIWIDLPISIWRRRTVMILNPDDISLSEKSPEGSRKPRSAILTGSKVRLN